MQFLQAYGKELFALLVPVITWVLNSYFRAKAKLDVAAPHRFTFLVHEPLRDERGNIVQQTQTIHTTSHVIVNSGKETATKVEFVFNWKPPLLNVWPSRSYDEREAPDGRYVLVFESLSPRETVGVEVLSFNQELPHLINVRSDQCTATNIDMYPQPVVAPWKRRLAVLLLLSGLALVVYVVVLILQFLILGTVESSAI